MKGYHINDVYKSMCDCWNVPPIRSETKQPFYSGKPALLLDGELDNACRPLYINLINHYMPNSQQLLFTERAHMVGGIDMDRLMRLSLAPGYPHFSRPSFKKPAFVGIPFYVLVIAAVT